MDRRRLECFIALAEELHFHRAADRCHMTQPAMSQQLRLLEQQLQAQLANRNKRRVSLTRAGEVFLQEARHIVRQMDTAAQLVRRTDRGELGHLRVGVTSPALYVVFPEILALFRQQLPDVSVLVEEMTTAEQEQALRDGRIQIGIGHPPLDDPSLACEMIARSAFNLVLAEDNPLSRKPQLELADLASEHFILFPRKIGPKLYDTIIGLCRSAGFSPMVILEAYPAQSIIALACAGYGVGFIASPLQRLPRPGVVYRPLQGAKPYLTLGVAFLADGSSPAISAFVAAAKCAGAQINRQS